MAKDDIGGVWRTISGRRVFIKDGQDLATAMKESGKFNNLKTKKNNWKNANEEIMKERKIVSDWENGAITTEVALSRFKGDKERATKIFESMGYHSPFKKSDEEENKSIKELNDEMLGDKYKGKGETPSLVYSNGRRIDIANNADGGKTATIWKDGKIERKTNLPDNVKGDKTKEYFDNYLEKLDNQKEASESKFSGVEFEKNIPHEMRFKEYDTINNDKDLYWVTQEPFTKEMADKFANEFKKQNRFENAYVTVRDFSNYQYKDDVQKGNLVKFNKDGSYDDSGYKSKMNEYGWEYSKENLKNSFADEVKNYKPKDNNEYHSAKEVLLSRFNRTYNDGDTKKEAFEKRMNNVRVLEETEDYVLYANKDNDDDFINVQYVSSYDPNSRFREMPSVYFEQDYKGNIKKGTAQVNWGAYGSQDPKTTKEFIQKLTKAQAFAEKINEGKDYSKMWENTSNLNRVTEKTKIENAFREYKTEHPNSTMTLEDFKKQYK